jgi:protein TonB
VVNVWLYISEAGVVEKAEVNRSSGVDELDAAATTLAKDMVFRPAANAGEPVGVWVSIPISFSRSR